jgi:hypothetical protein
MKGRILISSSIVIHNYNRLFMLKYNKDNYLITVMAIRFLMSAVFLGFIINYTLSNTIKAVSGVNM